jgi:DNA-binding CsgD family transcriptional regulator
MFARWGSHSRRLSMNIASAGHQAGTVRSHLDRIRDKTGCRRRADLTRLALTAGLV